MGMEMVPMSMGYRHLEIGPLTAEEARAAQSAALAAAAARIAGPPAMINPLFSMYSEDSSSSSEVEPDHARNFFDENRTDSDYSDSEGRPTYFAGPAILRIGPSETVNSSTGHLSTFF
jgi:hypothetical protein